MKTLFEVRVRHNGPITLPIELRKRAGIAPGTPLTLHDLGNGVLLLSKARSRTAKLADSLAQQWQEAGASLEDMLAALRQVRTEKH